MNRAEQIKRLETEEFDCLIIGGGASGAGCVLDSALRGYKTALIEKTDFASASSSKSTKLIHGGVRYLEQAFKQFDFQQLAQVKHGLEERHYFLQNAPHLTRPLALMTPVFSWLEGLYFTIGLTIYGWFASSRDRLPKSKWLTKAEVLKRIPTLSKKIHSAVMYYDGQLDDARYCLALIQTANEAGATAVNYLELVDLEHDEQGRLVAALAIDNITKQKIRIRAKVFINCTGSFADTIRQKANPTVPKRIHPSKGVHVMLPLNIINSKDALLIPETKDGRLVFAIPFLGKLMLGTTDTEYKDLEAEPLIEKDEIDFLLSSLQPYLESPIDKTIPMTGFGGIRPLIAATDKKGTKSLLRDHEVEWDKTSNLVSLLGGKWTTYRLMAKDTLDLISEDIFHQDKPCKTAHQFLIGGADYDEKHWTSIQENTDLPTDVCQHINQHYGDQADKLLALVQTMNNGAERILIERPYLIAEIVYAVRFEMACTIRDFLARRLRLEILNWEEAKSAAPIVGQIMGKTLSWTKEKTQISIDDYIHQLEKFQQRARIS